MFEMFYFSHFNIQFSDIKNILSSGFGATSRNDQYANGIDESIKQQALAEEEAMMNQYKVGYLVLLLFSMTLQMV